MDVLVTFKAGIANLIDNVVTPDTRRGELRVAIEHNEGLLHFQWLVRGSTGAIEPPVLDIVVMPEEADFVQVPLDPISTVGCADAVYAQVIRFTDILRC